MNIIIVGCGKIGTALTSALSEEGHNIAIIDLDGEVVNVVASENDVIGVEGNGVSVTVQNEAGLEHANLLIATTGSDEVNLLCSLVAKRVNSEMKAIVRVRNPIYINESEYFKEVLGLSMIINPEWTMANEIARQLRFPFADKIDTLARGRIEILGHTIGKDSPLDGMRIMDMNRKLETDVLICGVEREGEVIIPNGSFKIKSGDKVSFIASGKEASKFFRRLKADTHQVKNTMIIGGGKTALYLAGQLLGMGVGVLIIEKNKERCEFLEENLENATVICGDGTDQNLLLEEGIEQVESMVALTDIDEENILLSFFAKKVNPKIKVLTKINRDVYDYLMADIDVGTMMHMKTMVVDYSISLARALQNSLGSNVETLVHIMDGRAEALEFHVGENCELAGKPIMDLKLKPNLLIAAIRRGVHITYPRGQDQIRAGDNVVVVTTWTGLNDITDILRSRV
ncbi:MAG: Trk system potassium transporter TrkA [Lachnospiraceae bacterium]|nr:Trk system potassium transporter TrkA [Lachnospiraceae bacterium]